MKLALQKVFNIQKSVTSNFCFFLKKTEFVQIDEYGRFTRMDINFHGTKTLKESDNMVKASVEKLRY